MEKKIIVEGEMIHHVGYRPFLLTEALKFKKITNFEAENILEERKQKVVINIVGEEQKVLEFTKFVKNNFPGYAKNCKVISEEDRCSSEVMHIHDFRDILNVEQQNNIVQGGLELKYGINNLGKKIDDGFNNLGKKIGDGFNKMDDNFKGMDKKYKLISEGMFSIVNELKDANKQLGERLEKTEKNIEKLLEILVQQKKE